MGTQYQVNLHLPLNTFCIYLLTDTETTQKTLEMREGITRLKLTKLQNQQRKLQWLKNGITV